MTIAGIFLQLTFIFIANFITLTIAEEKSEDMKQRDKALFSFEKLEELKDWIVVNDGVMGGLSKGEIILSDSNTAVFQGNISLDNNGGFSSTRTKPRSYDLSDFDGIILRLKGDGKKYQFRLRMKNLFDGISYRYHFNTDNKKWITIRVPFNECVPVFRGRVLDNVELISPKKIQQIGFLISDKKAGSFRLEIDWIKAYKKFSEE